MADVAHSLVRRAVGVTQSHLNDDGNQDRPLKEVALWGLALLWITSIFYLAVVSAISYTYGDVVATLAMIETPSTDILEIKEASPDSKEPLLPPDSLAKDAEVHRVNKAPITAKLRTALRHLRSVAGPFARFRGLHIALIYHTLHSFILGFLGMITGPYLRPLASIVVSVGLCRIHMTWTHAVVSMPTSKSWWQRIPSREAGRKAVLPTAIWATAQQACLYVPGALFVSVYEFFKHPEVYSDNTETMRKIAIVQLFAVCIIFLATVLLVVVPAEVTLKRVEASMLPEAEETIVPFDKSFSGKFKPEPLGGIAAISVLDAWRTFGKESRIRLIKLYCKIFAIQIATALVFGMIFIGELKLVTGGDFERLVEAARKTIKGEL